MLLGYIILGNIWIDDPELKQKYENYEIWLTTKENSGQVLSLTYRLRLSNGA